MKQLADNGASQKFISKNIPKSIIFEEIKCARPNLFQTDVEIDSDTGAMKIVRN
jgi:hypothetical protein